MYVTRPRSHYYKFPNAVSEPPPEGPHSGILVIEEDKVDPPSRCGWKLCMDPTMSLPFPQNRRIKVKYTIQSGRNWSTYRDDVFFIPVIGQPLSHNCYYVVKTHGDYNQGKACLCSKEEDMSTCCLCDCVDDAAPSPFDYRNIYHQVQIIRRAGGRFYAQSVASDGIPPDFLRRDGWEARTSVDPTNYLSGVALGLNANLRRQMPDLNFPITSKFSSTLVVGKWYIPYIFIKEDEPLEDQMKRSMFYEMTLEQYWENICTSENTNGNVVEVGVSVFREMAFLNGNEVVRDNNIKTIGGVVWFKPMNSTERRLGLGLPIWERMKWEEERGGWVCGDKVQRVERIEVYRGNGGWKNFGCFVLVERFVLKRMDGSLALTYVFRHTNKVRIRWE